MQVVRVDLDERKIDFELRETLETARSMRPDAKSGKKKRSQRELLRDGDITLAKLADKNVISGLIPVRFRLGKSGWLLRLKRL
ncbi:hypothetical protein [Aliamphritea spongicola]|nr:hypothetical protein [Aliamphritea spongicola]